MKWHDKRWLLWWAFPTILALSAGIMPDTFLDSPYTTIPHEAAFVLRYWMCKTAFLYIGVVLLLRIGLEIKARLARYRKSVQVQP